MKNKQIANDYLIVLPKHNKIFWEQFKTGKIVNKVYHDKKYSFQYNEYKGLILKKQLHLKDYWTVHFKDDITETSLSYINFWNDKYVHPSQVSHIYGPLKKVIRMIDEALYWQNDNLKFGTLYATFYDNNHDINIIDRLTLCKLLVKENFHINENGIESIKDAKYTKSRWITPLGEALFKDLSEWTNKYGLIYFLKTDYTRFGINYTTNKVKTWKQVENIFNEFINKMKQIDPNFVNVEISDYKQKIYEPFSKYLFDFYN